MQTPVPADGTASVTIEQQAARFSNFKAVASRVSARHRINAAIAQNRTNHAHAVEMMMAYADLVLMLEKQFAELQQEVAKI